MSNSVNRESAKLSKFSQFGRRLYEACGGGSFREITGFLKIRGVEIDYDTVRRYLLGEREPNLEMLEKIAKASKYSLHWLITGIGPKQLNSADFADAHFDFDHMWERIAVAARTDDISKIAKMFSATEDEVARWRNKESFPTAGHFIHALSSKPFLHATFFWLVTGQGSQDYQPKEIRRGDNSVAFTTEYSIRLNRKVGMVVEIPLIPRSLTRRDPIQDLVHEIGSSIGRYVEKAVDNKLGRVDQLDEYKHYIPHIPVNPESMVEFDSPEDMQRVLEAQAEDEQPEKQNKGGA